MYLNDSEMSALPAGDDDGVFDNLVKLEVLRLHNNKLTELPDGVFDNLAKLKWLTVHDDEIGALYEGVLDNNTKLTILTLSGNMLESIPNNFIPSLGFSKLLLEDSNLESLPDGFFSVESLKLALLRLDGNPETPFEFKMETEVTRVC